MKIINLNKTWIRLANEIHRIKPRLGNLSERETLFGLQIMLGQYELAKSEGNDELKKFCVDVLETYEKYNINGHIIWKR